MICDRYKNLVSDADSLMKIMDKDIADFRVKIRELNEENVYLRDEIERREESIDTLTEEHSIVEQKLKDCIQKCQELEKENDEQKYQLNELNEKQITVTLNLQRCIKEKEKLSEQLEAAEFKVQAIPFLTEELESKTKLEKKLKKYIDNIDKMQKELDEKEDKCRHLSTTITVLKDTSINIEEYENTISSLREENRRLAHDNEELQSFSIFNSYPFGERISISSISNSDECNTHSTPYKSIPVDGSLHAELQAVGYTAECSRSDKKDLEEELNGYDAAIFVMLEQLEKVIQFFVTMRGPAGGSPHFNPQDTDATARSVDVLKHKVSLLLNMATEEIARRNTRQDSSTQLRADPANAIDSLNQFGIESFRDLLSTQAYRTIHTLSSSVPSSSLIAEDSKSQMFGYQNGTNTTIDVLPFVQGDGLAWEDRGEKSAPLAMEVSDQKNLPHIEENRSSEMPKVSGVLRVDTKALATLEEEKKDARSFQVPEVSSASNPTSPRRKISVYCRSFDVVTVQDQREDHSGSLEVRQSSGKPDDSPARIDRIAAADRNSTPDTEYPFNHVYRSVKSDSDSSNSTPGKHFQDSMDDEPSVGPILRRVHLAPTRLRFSEARNKLDKSAEASNRASPVSTNSDELDISISPSSSSFLSPIDRCREDDDASAYSPSPFVDKVKMDMKSVVLGSASLNENVSQTFSPNRCLFPRDPANSAKIVNSEDPHSQASVQRVSGSQPRIEQPVDSQMSSREDSSAVSSNEREPATGSVDLCGTINGKAANEASRTVDVVSSTSLADDPVPARTVLCKSVAQSDEKTRERNRLTKQKTRQSWLLNTKRSYSEGENLGRLECHCKRRNGPLIPEGSQRRVFPSLTDIRLQESGLATLLSDGGSESSGEDPSELELQKKYTAFSLCLCIDRLTLPRRTAMSVRQRDQSEKNLSSEVENMQQDIQELAPLCMDRESAERVDRVRNRLDMIVRCAHRVSCAAETLGAVQQERRVSRAVLLADKYLQLLQSRCEKLAANVAETKRILIENDLVIEENSSVLNDELPRIRYRSGTPANNRMMMVRRRASVATMSRPMGTTQDVTKDLVRQRNSVSGRMTLRRPSFSYESSSKWENEKLDRTESSNSISELRGIFEQAESRRSSREENNNMRLNNSNSQSTLNCAKIDNEIWTNVKEEEEAAASSEVSENENVDSESRSSTKSSHSFQLKRRRRRPIWPVILSILIFFLLFYIIHAMTENVVVNHVCQGHSLNNLIEYVIERYRQVKKAAPHPM